MSADGRVFSREWKRKNGFLSVLGPLICWLAPIGLGVVVVLIVMPEGQRAEPLGRVVSLGLMVGLVLGVAVQYLQPKWGYGKLRAALAAKVRERDGVDAEEWGALFVGWSPGHQVQNHEGDTDADVGLLLLGPTYMTYLGDALSFSLRREGVWRLDQSVASGPFMPAKRVLIGHTWPDGYQHFFSLESRESTHLAGLGAANRRLCAQLDAWWRGTAGLTADPPAVADGPPEAPPPAVETKPVVSGPGNVLAIIGGVVIGMILGAVAGVGAWLAFGLTFPVVMLIALIVAVVLGNVAGILLMRYIPRPED